MGCRAATAGSSRENENTAQSTRERSTTLADQPWDELPRRRRMPRDRHMWPRSVFRPGLEPSRAFGLRRKHRIPGRYSGCARCPSLRDKRSGWCRRQGLCCLLLLLLLFFHPFYSGSLRPAFFLRNRMQGMGVFVSIISNASLRGIWAPPQK